jgi:hypothetical protein
MGNETVERGLEVLISVHTTEINQRSMDKNPRGFNDPFPAADCLQQP